MSDKSSLSHLTLQERLKQADYLTRELSEHLRQAYLPKLAALRSLAKVYDPHEVSDNQILEHSLAVLEAEKFTDDLYLKLRTYLDSISEEMSPILFNSKSSAAEKPKSNEPVFDLDDMLSE